MADETATDKVLDKMVEICRDMKAGNQIQGLWKVFNIMVAFIKGQANLIRAMDVEIKRQGQQLARLQKEIDGLKSKPTKIPAVN